MNSTFRLSLLCFVILTLVLSEQSRSQVKVVYCYPVPNALNVSPKTTIGIRYAETLSKSPLASTNFLVTGSISGKHEGKVILAAWSKMVIFTPDKLFSPNENVTVTVNPLQTKTGKATALYHFSFQISKSKILPSTLVSIEENQIPKESLILSSSSSDTPPPDFPPIEITKDNNPSPGQVYLSNFTYIQSMYGMYLMILDNTGNLLYQHNTSPLGAQNFRLQKNGNFTYFDVKGKKFYEMDTNFVLIDSFSAASGYQTDYHELCMLPDGGYALLAMYNEKVDLRKLSGDSNAIVLYYALQQFDRDKNLIFEWRTEDPGHFEITDATNQDYSLHTIDYVHCNSIDFDSRDTSFILSSRSLDEITKINSQDGSMIWRLGGKHNQFSMKGSVDWFSHQHDVRKILNGNITLFDNGNLRSAPRFSRAVEYTLDEKNKTATQIWEFRHDPDIYADAMGSVERLPNGNTLIGWGLSDSAAATEVKNDGISVWEMRLPIGHYNYRVYKTNSDLIRPLAVTDEITPTVNIEPNYPNPFSTSTTINFTVGGRTPITLIVFDALGRKLKTLFDGIVEAGQYSAKFESEDLPNGIYVCKLITPSCSVTRTLLLSK